METSTKFLGKMNYFKGWISSNLEKLTLMLQGAILKNEYMEVSHTKSLNIHENNNEKEKY